MIVSGYSLELYCDNENGRRLTNQHPNHEYGEFPHVYTGERGSTCRKMARKSGWKLDLENGEAYCPKCNSKEQK